MSGHYLSTYVCSVFDVYSFNKETDTHSRETIMSGHYLSAYVCSVFDVYSFNKDRYTFEGDNYVRALSFSLCVFWL